MIVKILMLLLVVFVVYAAWPLWPPLSALCITPTLFASPRPAPASTPYSQSSTPPA